jgi:hypothetical protein
MSDAEIPTDDERVARRAELLDEERVAGTDDPVAQAQVILEDSETRTLDRGAAPGGVAEHRRSEDTVEPT